MLYDVKILMTGLIISFFPDTIIDDTHSSGESTDSEDEKYIEGRDDKDSEDDENENIINETQPLPADCHTTENGGSCNIIPEEDSVDSSIRTKQKSSTLPKQQSTLAGPTSDSVQGILTCKSLDCLSLETMSDRKNNNNNNSISIKTEPKPKPRKQSQGFNFEIPTTKRKTSKDNRKFSTESDPGVRTEFQTASSSKLHRQGAVKGSRLKKDSTVKDPPASGPQAWANRR